MPGWALNRTETVRVFRKQLLTLLLAVALGCDDGPSGLTAGNLSITVAGLPAGTAAAVTVTGPDGFDQSVTGTQTLSQLTPGVYTIAAGNVQVGATTYAGSPASQTVSVNSSASASVIYSASNPNLGSLLVNITGLPSNANAAVAVTGPNGYSQSATSTQSLTSLAPGTYTVTAQEVVTTGGTTYTPSPAGQDAGVTASNTTTATVRYSPPSGGTLNLHIPRMYLTQSAQTLDNTVPLVQNRAGFLRIFVVANQVNAAMPAVRVRLYQNLVFQSEHIIPAPGPSVPAAVDEGSLSNSWNLAIPAGEIRPGLSIVAEVDPDNNFLESDESDNAYPGGGPLALNVRSVPTLNVTLVPIKQRGNNLAASVANSSGFLDVVRKMHPIAGHDLAVHAQYTTQTSDTLEDDNGNGAWGKILGEIEAVRVAEGSQRYYYGVARVSYTSGVAGVAYVSTAGSSERVAMGWDYLPSGAVVMAHELAHNWARNHAPCGAPGGLDSQYPFADGRIGIYGLDVATQSLKQPSTTDIMSYCDPKWIGDYTYKAIMDYLSPPAPVLGGLEMSASAGQAAQPVLMVWGHIRDGELVLEPAFQVTTRPKLPEKPGPYSIEATAADGSRLLNLSFAPDELADVPGNQKNFAFAIPLPSASGARISTLRLSGMGRQAIRSAAVADSAGDAQLNMARLDSVEVSRVPGGNVGLRWNPRAHPMVMVRDAASGEVLSLARTGEVQLPAVHGELDLVLSDGVRSRVKRVRVR